MKSNPNTRAKKLVSKFSTALMIASLLHSFSLPAEAATVSDSSANCQLTVTSGGVSVDSISVHVTLNGIYCIAQLKTFGTYSVTVPNTTTSLDYLIVGGGGGGGSGGGGGGGVKQDTNISVNSSSPYTVVVGAGGTGGSGNKDAGPNATAGGNSTFSSYSVLGGGRGGQGGQAAGNGASGGGAQYDCTTVESCRGLGTVGQGNNGAASTWPSYGGGGGGGGAGSAGGNTTLSHIGGNGGNGVTSSITGSTVYYGGGGGGSINSNNSAYCGLRSPGTSNTNYYCNGTNPTLEMKGGGTGGLGGGGDGSSYGYTGGTRGQYANATAGAPNTGGGGGGTDPEDSGAGAGGSGLVVLRWVAPTNLKSITFNSNDGTPETSTQRVTSGVSTPLNSGTFARSGYIFSGWTTNADGTGTSYTDATNITTTSDLTLYAKWITGVNKVITFNGNSSTSGSMATQSAGTATALNANAFSRTNYTFTGWNTAANGTGYSYADAAVYAFTTDATLYAQWRLTRTPYTVTFYANAGSGATPAQTADTPTALSLSGFTRSGYNFLGWNTDWSSNSASYIDGQKYTFNANLPLYAIWVAQAPNTVTFNGNNATSGATASQTASSNTTLNANGFSRDGYTFLNWNTAANGSGTQYNSGYTYSFATNIPLYATWSRNLTISYAGNGATSGETPTAQSYYIGGSTLTVSSNAGNLARTGYTLVGWNTAANGSGTAYAIGGANATFSGDTTLYAQWLGSTYSILYTGNSNISGSAPSSQSYIYGDSGITLRGNSSSLTRTGYTFAGWNTQPDGTATAYTESQTAVTFAGDTVLFARWTGNTYTITYDLNKGTGETATASFLYGNSTTLLTPTRTGYSLRGWYDTTTAGTKIGDAGAAYSTALSPTLYTQWLINSYTYTYNGNGGTVDTSPVTYTYEDSALTLRTPTRSSYQFNGWYTATTGGTRIGGAGASNTPTTTQNLYAQWTQLSLVGLGSATLINSNTTSAGVGTSFSASSGGTTVTVSYIADALPAGTVIDAYLLPNTTRAAGLIPDATNLLLSLVVAWKATDGAVPSVASGNPITVTIVNSGIKAGAKIYCLIGDAVTLLGTATVDGTASVSFTDDPEIVIANPAVTPPPSGGGSSGGRSPTPTETPVPTPVPTPKPKVSVPTPFVPITPSVTISTGQAIVEIRTPSGALSSARKEVNASPTDPNAQVITIALSQVTLSTTNANGVPNKPQNATLTLAKGDVIKFSARGFKPSTEVSVYIFSDPILLGKVVTDTQGNYTSSLPSPDGLEVGSHTIQLVGYLMDDSFAKLSLPVLVIQPIVMKTLKIFFEMGKSTLSTVQLKSIKAFAASIDKKKLIKVSIKGFVQKTTRQINDEKLPRLRAESVALALKKYSFTKKPSLNSGWYAVEKDWRARRVEILIKVAK